MKRRIARTHLVTLLTLTAFSTLDPQVCPVFAQGSLTPPGAPVATMKTLDQVEPRRPISTLPFTITQPGSYYLTTNATVSGSGITIRTGDVSLDLCGFTLTGDGGGADYGVSIDPLSGPISGISVRNGKFNNFGVGIVAGEANDIVIEDNQVRNTTGSRGIWLANACQGAVIRRNLLVNCQGGVVLNAFDADVITGVTIENNTVAGGTGEAVNINAQPGGTVRHATVRHNHFSNKTGTAMNVSESGTGVVERLTFDSNHCTGNGNLGMVLPADTQSLVVRNFFVNLTLSTLLATGNTVGPIVSTSGSLGTTGADISPWANIRN